MDSIYINRQNSKIIGQGVPAQNFTRLIAIGASAGGVETLKEFLLNLPEQLTNIAIIIGFPIDSVNRQYLSAAINTNGAITLQQAKQSEEVKANTVYYPEPGYQLAIKGNQLQVTSTAAAEPGNPVDNLFESLCVAAGEKSIAIVLSGLGTDGAKGIKIIKEAGGYVIVQAPPTAMYNAMPIAAINTGCAHLVIPPFKMGNAIWDAIQLQQATAGLAALQYEPHCKEALLEIPAGFKANKVNTTSVQTFLPGTLYCNEDISSVDALVKETIFNCYQHTYLIVNSSCIIQEVKGDTSLFIKGLSDLTNQYLGSVINEALKAVVMASMTKATSTQQLVKSRVQIIELYSEAYVVRIIVKPIQPAAGTKVYYLIIFENLQAEKFVLNGIQTAATSWV